MELVLSLPYRPLLCRSVELSIQVALGTRLATEAALVWLEMVSPSFMRPELVLSIFSCPVVCWLLRSWDAGLNTGFGARERSMQSSW